MIVKFVRTGETKDFNESYAYRLIEQGKAVLGKAGTFHEQGRRKRSRRKLISRKPGENRGVIGFVSERSHCE